MRDIRRALLSPIRLNHSTWRRGLRPFTPSLCPPHDFTANKALAWGHRLIKLCCYNWLLHDASKYCIWLRTGIKTSDITFFHASLPLQSNGPGTQCLILQQVTLLKAPNVWLISLCCMAKELIPWNTNLKKPEDKLSQNRFQWIRWQWSTKEVWCWSVD